MKSVSAQPSTSKIKIRSRMAAAGIAALALIAAGCSSSNTSSSAGATPVKGGTAVWAEQPAQQPTYIFPYVNSQNISNTNLFNLQYLMYRPLYWFGVGNKPTVNYAVSVANPPTLSGRTVTITLKHYMWSNGTQVTAKNVMFWLNIKVVSPTSLQMTLKHPYSLTWFLYNDLSQVTPMPTAWDRTASGPSNCEAVVKDCTAVYNYLAGQAKNLSGYASSPIWGVVDGPWRLSQFTADGHNIFVPNKAYTGPVKPKLAEFQEVPFTTDAAEYNVLRSSAAGGQKI